MSLVDQFGRPVEIRRAKDAIPPAPIGWRGGNYSRIGVLPGGDFGSYSPAWAAINILSEDIAKLPFQVWRDLADGGRRQAKRQALYQILKRPNPWQTPFELLQFQMFSLLVDGNSYSLILRNRDGDPDMLIPINPYYVTTYQAPSAELYYQISFTSVNIPYLPPYANTPFAPARDVLHIRGLSWDGINGLSPLAAARNALEYGVALQNQGSKLFENGGKPGGVITVPYNLNDEQAARLKQNWDELYGHDGQGRTALLEEGMKFEPITFKAVDSQFLENRRFQVEEIARIYRIPVHMLASGEKLTYNNLEFLNRNYVDWSLMPWAKRIEQAYDRMFLEAGYYTEFNFDDLLRADTKTRYEMYAAARQWGILNANECRRLEGLNPYPGGEEYWQPVNMAPAGTVPAVGEDTEE